MGPSFPSYDQSLPPPAVRWVYPLVLAAAVAWASSRGQVAGPALVGFDKVAHALVFGLFGTLVARTQPRRRWWLGVVAASAFGVVDEVRQSFTPGRAVEVADWVADTAGAAMAVSLYAWWPGYHRLLETKLWGRRARRIDFTARPVTERAA